MGLRTTFPVELLLRSTMQEVVTLVWLGPLLVLSVKVPTQHQMPLLVAKHLYRQH